MKVKICGLTNQKDALMACGYGADFIGIVVSPESKRKISLKEAKEIFENKYSYVQSVVVTTSTKFKDIQKIADSVKPNMIQLHGEIKPEDIEKLKFNGKFSKGIPVTKNVDYEDYMERYVNLVDFFLLDSKVKGVMGGTGKTHDWDISAEIVKKSKKPVFLAGGLNPENVKEAIEKVKPYGVDVASGVEIKKGKKDPEKVNIFIKGAKE